MTVHQTTPAHRGLGAQLVLAGLVTVGSVTPLVLHVTIASGVGFCLAQAVLAPVLWAVTKRDGRVGLGLPVALVAGTSAVFWIGALVLVRTLVARRDRATPTAFEGTGIFLAAYPVLACGLVALTAVLGALFEWAARWRSRRS